MEIITIENIPQASESLREQRQNTCKIYIIECIGWVGSALILVAYIGNLERTTNFIFNFVGSTGVLIVCIKKKAFQPILLNAAWIIGSFYKYFLTS